MSHLRVPLFRNGYSLILSSATTSAFGLVYWVLAARMYTTESVGLNSAVISSMIFLANLSHFNLNNALNRFLPTAGEATGRLIIRFYLIGLTASVVASLVFTYFVGIWAPALSFLKSSPVYVLGFAGATMSWCIFALQDSAFVGLRQATWVPVENLIFALAKIALLFAFVGLFPRFGIVASWTVSVVLLILPVNLLIFRNLVPRHVRSTQDGAEPIVPSRIIKFVAGDYGASLARTVSFVLLPLMVLEKCGASSNAYYAMSWAMSYSLYLVGLNMGMSLVAEAAKDPMKLSAYSYRAFVQSSRLVVPAVVIVVIAAPYILRLFGEDYTSEGTLLLRLLCLSAIPYVATSLYLSIVRVQRRMRTLMLVLTTLSVLVITLSYFLLGAYGINGIGLAWLISQTVVATVLLTTQLGKLWLPHVNVGFLLHLLEVPRGLLWRWRNRHVEADSVRLLPDILSRITLLASRPRPVGWCTQGLARTLNDVRVIKLGPQGHPPVALLKLAQSDAAVASLTKHKETLARLNANRRLGPWCDLLPTLLAENEAAEDYYQVEEIQAGCEARTLLSGSDTRKRTLISAATAIGVLHQCTATSVVVDDEMLARWVDGPIARVRDSLAGHKPVFGCDEALERLTDQLHSSLSGRRLQVSWVHGDFSPGNILVTADGSEVTGILDWDQAAPENLPQLDLVLLFLSARMSSRHRELGDIVREMLSGAEWTSEEQDLLNAVQKSLPGELVGLRELVLLTWLRHVEANLSKSTRYFAHRLWTAKNIEAVLLCL